jgi:hypothetical protein
MSDVSSPQRLRVALPSALCLLVSAVLHTVLLVVLRGGVVLDDGPRLELRTQVEFGLADAPAAGQTPGAAPPPAKAVEPKSPPKPRKPKPAPDPNAFNLAVDAGAPAAPDPHAHDAAIAASALLATEHGQAAARSGQGSVEGALGDGSGAGLGDGSYAPAGATLALNVDLERVRKTALMLEAHALLDIIPEWQLLLSGSGLDPLRDLERVFVATPNLERASLVVSARHRLPQARIAAAVEQLAAEQRQPAQFRERSGFEVAPWRNRGPTERVIALTGRDQFTISRASDLPRVLGVAQALARLRSQQGFDPRELEEQGGLLAMQPNEAVALWIEGVPKYVHGDVPGVPRSLRMSIYHVDQFNSELRVRGEYASADAAAAARTAMEAMREQLSNDPKVIFVGLKSAFDSARIEQDRSALQLQVRLTLHQTRYLLHYVTRALRTGGS